MCEIKMHEPVVGRFACRESNLPPLTHEQRMKIIMAPFPAVETHTSQYAGGCGPRQRSAIDQDDTQGFIYLRPDLRRSRRTQ